MGNFNRDNKRSGGGFGHKFGGGKSFGGGKKFSDRDGGRPPMHPAVCDECGANCEVPFRPTGDRPIFCSTCFEKQNGGSSRPTSFGGDRRERPGFGDRPRFEDRQMFDALCEDCGKKCKVPFKPTAGKPVFCSDCFKKGGSGNKDSKEVMEQLLMLNTKIDKLIKILTPDTPTVKNEMQKVKKSKPKVNKALVVEDGGKEKAALKKKTVKKKK